MNQTRNLENKRRKKRPDEERNKSETLTTSTAKT